MYNMYELKVLENLFFLLSLYEIMRIKEYVFYCPCMK